jgi:hypothetical protein
MKLRNIKRKCSNYGLLGMKNFNALRMKFLIIALMSLTSSCASSQSPFSKPFELRKYRIDPVTLDRFKWCARVRDHFWQEWQQKCDYIPFSDKVRIKQALDAGFILQVRVKP